jgi:thioredoxin-related protein
MTFQGTAQVKFQEFSVEKALLKGKKENKMVIVYFSSNQCPGCKIMENHVFSNYSLGDLVNENFIVVRSSASSNEGRMEQYLYNIKMYPTQIYFKSDGNELIRLEGKNTLETVRSTVENALSGKYEQSDKKDKEEKEELIIHKGEIIKSRNEF